MKSRGFTIIELLIVITIMVTLLVLGTVNMSSSQANGRDAERKADIEAIALALEAYYTSGTDGSTTFGTYPSTSAISTVANITTNLRDIDTKSFTAPGLTLPDRASTSPSATFIAATCSGACGQTTSSVTPQPTKDQYVYQPLQSDGTLCTLSTQECRKFNMYYFTESDNNVNMVTSKNQ